MWVSKSAGLSFSWSKSAVMLTSLVLNRLLVLSVVSKLMIPQFFFPQYSSV